MKSNAPAEDVKRDYGKYLDKVVFMPKVNLDDKDATQKLNDYLRVLKPVAIEFKFAYDTNPLPYEVKKSWLVNLIYGIIRYGIHMPVDTTMIVHC